MNPQNKQNFERFKKQLEMLLADTEASAKRVVRRMAEVGYEKTVEETPVGDYTKNIYIDTQNKRIKYASFLNKSGDRVTFRVKHIKHGGNLKRNWQHAKPYKAGNSHIAGYSNNVEYSMYVNNGHRIVNGQGVTTGYVKGVRMLESGIKQAKRSAEAIFQAEVARIKKKTGF